MTGYALVATASNAAVLGVLAFAYWWRRREERAHLWFWVAMIVSVAFSLSRLAQMLGTWSDRPWLPARCVLGFAGLGAWVVSEFASAYTGQSPDRWVQRIVGAVAAVPVFLIIATDLVLTRTPVVRTLWGGEQFIGVELGPFYFLFTLSTMA